MSSEDCKVLLQNHAPLTAKLFRDERFGTQSEGYTLQRVFLVLLSWWMNETTGHTNT